MDLLFLAHRAPSAPDRGDRIRSYHVLKYLAGRARVHVVAFDEGPAPRPDLPLGSWTVVPRTKSRARAGVEALATGRPVSLTAFADPAMTAALARVPQVDATYVFSSQMAQHVPDGFVMDFVDVDSAKFAQQADGAVGPTKWLLKREARLLAAYERDTAARASASLFVSEAEAALFGQGRAIGNGIDAEHFRPDIVPGAAAPSPLIVFTGQMDYQPNVDAVTWFAREVLPCIQGATFAIVGRAPTGAARALAEANVLVTGEVDDTRPWLAAADVCVAPLLLARGVQNKVLEAMAMARPVVATPAAAEGIDHHGTIRVAEPADFAGAVKALISSPGSLGQDARARVLAGYAWDARLAPLGRLLGLDRKLAA